MSDRSWASHIHAHPVEADTMVRFTIRKGKPDFVTVVVGSVLNLTFESEEAAVSWLDLVAREIGAVQLH